MRARGCRRRPQRAADEALALAREYPPEQMRILQEGANPARLSGGGEIHNHPNYGVHSALILAALMMGHHLSISALW